MKGGEESMFGIFKKKGEVNPVKDGRNSYKVKESFSLMVMDNEYVKGSRHPNHVTLEYTIKKGDELEIEGDSRNGWTVVSEIRHNRKLIRKSRGYYVKKGDSPEEKIDKIYQYLEALDKKEENGMEDELFDWE